MTAGELSFEGPWKGMGQAQYNCSMWHHPRKRPSACALWQVGTVQSLANICKCLVSLIPYRVYELRAVCP